jgi:tetratricopeptide (TPR) repeat protein
VSERSIRGALALRPSADVPLVLGLAAGLAVLAFSTTGGIDQAIAVSAANTWAQIVITLLGAGACAAMLVLGAPGRAWGGVTVTLFAVLAAFTALSIAWSVQPDNSWQAANLTLAFLATFAGGASLARMTPARWRVLVSAIAVLSVVLSGYALLAKVFPASLAANDTQGRLQAPLGYWNATGVMAAMGLAPCLWASGRRDGGRCLRALTVPCVAILISVVVLSYSRSAVLVAVVCVGSWLAFVPGRLRAVAMLTLSAAGAAVITGWALSRTTLTGDSIALPARTDAGHTYGIVLLLSIAALIAAGAGAVIAAERVTVPERIRRRVGTALVIVVALLPVGGVAAVAASSRGLTGEISHAWSSLTSTRNGIADTASRFGQLGSSRPRYWQEGITVAEHALLKGVGALGYATARTHYTDDPAVVEHAHSYLVQTFADLGLIGLAANLALLIAWWLSAARAVALRARWATLSDDQTAEREGLTALVLVVLVFGLQSAIDWTWFFPGVAVPALLCAGWLAGRGPLSSPGGRSKRPAPILARPAIGASLTVLTALTLLGAWLIWQPLRSADAATAAVAAAARGDKAAAFSDARDAAGADPMSLQPLFVLSELYQSVGDPAAARAELVSAVRLQPDNGDSWLSLGIFDLQSHYPRRALVSLERALALAPATMPTTIKALAQARAELAGKPG